MANRSMLFYVNNNLYRAEQQAPNENNSLYAETVVDIFHDGIRVSRQTEPATMEQIVKWWIERQMEREALIHTWEKIGLTKQKEVVPIDYQHDPEYDWY